MKLHLKMMVLMSQSNNIKWIILIQLMMMKIMMKIIRNYDENYLDYNENDDLDQYLLVI